MRLIFGSDHRGQDLCRILRQYLKVSNGTDVDYVESDGESIDYPDIAARVATTICNGLADYGILICGTGIGMCIVANKFPGIRAVPCHSIVAAEFSRRFNDANVLCLSGDMLGELSGPQIVEKWLETPFEGGKHTKRLEKIREIEELGIKSASVISTAAQQKEKLLTVP